MKEKRTTMTDMLALAVFAVFAVCVLAVLLRGAGVYRNLVDGGQQRFENRTAAQYVTTRVRQDGSVTVADFDGCTALVFRETIDGKVYLTRVYCWDGYLRELFCAENAALSPQDGEKILPAQELEAERNGRELTVTLDGDHLFFCLKEEEAKR